MATGYSAALRRGSRLLVEGQQAFSNTVVYGSGSKSWGALLAPGSSSFKSLTSMARVSVQRQSPARQSHSALRRLGPVHGSIVSCSTAAGASMPAPRCSLRCSLPSSLHTQPPLCMDALLNFSRALEPGGARFQGAVERGTGGWGGTEVEE